ncbi:MAG: DnaJ domain-containing protein, partial [Alicyclobacillus sp.]|nr:DnaJ domain-containing protein [Alicyclobacillus sp.]
MKRMNAAQEVRCCPHCRTLNRVHMHLLQHAACGACGQPLDLNYYEILGVSPSASSTEIKRSFRRLALRWHPDRHPDSPYAKDVFNVLYTAYVTLTDPVERAQYDRSTQRAGGQRNMSTSTRAGRTASHASPTRQPPSAHDDVS